jgi:hypothetical protein
MSGVGGEPLIDEADFMSIFVAAALSIGMNRAYLGSTPSLSAISFEIFILFP